MINFVKLVQHTADEFERIIKTHTTRLQEIETEDYGWCNMRWCSTQFRLAHIERFDQPKFSVLHMVIFPHIMDPAPIFGFDVIASDTKITGVFFDRSPTIKCWGPLTDQTWQEPRDRPDWGHIFSDHWIACRPTPAEAVDICALACELLKDYLNRLAQEYSHRVSDIIQAQNAYSMNQRQNEHTTRVIKKILGTERGEQFINEILFPIIK